MSKLLFFLLSAWSITGCSRAKDVAGHYKIDRNPVSEVLLTLNSDQSFVEFVNTYGCEPTWYFGYYKQTKGRITLSQRSGYVGYLNRHDTIVYYKNPDIKGRRITVLFNEQKPFDIADLYANGNLHLGKVDKSGTLIIPDDIILDSLRIESGIFRHRHFVLKQPDFSRLFIIIYDYTFENCSDMTFLSNANLKITSEGLLFYPNWERKSKPEKVFLRREAQ